MPGELQLKKLFRSLLIFMAVTACVPQINLPNPLATATQATSTNLPPPLQQSEVTFQVAVPDNTDGGLYLIILDEVTGLALNPIEFQMQNSGSGKYTAKVPIANGSVVKYRYIKRAKAGTAPIIEYTSNNKQVRYRLFHSTGSAVVNDIISGWIDAPYHGPTGKIQGQITDSKSNSPIPNIMVTAEGISTLTASDGTFVLEGMLPGIHNMVAYSLDGTYETFQQEARIDAGAMTQAIFQLIPAAFINVTFVLHSPPLGQDDPPIRMVGNLYSLGNTFTDLAGGTSIVPSKAKLLARVGDGQYGINLNLPVGYDLRYKYTLGDGFWNAELTPAGSFRVRQFIVDNHHPIIEDYIDSWRDPRSAPISFSVIVPPGLPETDNVSIQLHPFAWMEPLPMKNAGNNRWSYTLYSPLNMLTNVGYRYCRNEQCGVADVIDTKGENASGYPFMPSLIPQTFQDDIKNWAWWSQGPAQQAAPGDVNKRDTSFIAGIELLPAYSPAWQSHYNGTFKDVQKTGANWIVLSPTWTLTGNNPIVLENVPGKDALWPDLMEMTDLAHQQSLEVALYPGINFGSSVNSWWEKGNRDQEWWQNWLDRYRTYLLNFADFATQNNAGMLILGDPDINPALPDGKLADGTTSNVPTDVNNWWKQIIHDIRSRYKGKLAWAIAYPDGIKTPAPFLSEFDAIYLLWSARLNDGKYSSRADLVNEIGHQLDENVKSFKETANKPVYLAIKYPSAKGSTAGCVEFGKSCHPFSDLDQPNANNQSVHVDLQEQIDVYSACLAAINQRNWIDGFISTGYYPPVALQDASSSIHGKPSAQLLASWFKSMVSQ
jgi:hypothetical protein